MGKEYDSLTSLGGECFAPSTCAVKGAAKESAHPQESTIALRQAVYTNFSVKKKVYRVKAVDMYMSPQKVGKTVANDATASEAAAMRNDVRQNIRSLIMNRKRRAQAAYLRIAWAFLKMALGMERSKKLVDEALDPENAREFWKWEIDHELYRAKNDE